MMALLIAGGLVFLLVLCVGMFMLTFTVKPESPVIAQSHVRPAGGMKAKKTALSEPLFVIADGGLRK
jgi:hypothetical protein